MKKSCGSATQSATTLISHSACAKDHTAADNSPPLANRANWSERRAAVRASCMFEAIIRQTNHGACASK